MSLGEEQIQRYSRHILLPGVGGIGQERLLASSALIAFSAREEGAAVVALTYLAAAGLGRIGWCPLEGARGGGGLRDESPFLSFLGACAEDGVRSLNPDAELIPCRPDEAAAEVFDALVWLGDASGFAGRKPAARITLRGAAGDEAGEILEGSGGPFGDLASRSRGEGAPMAATQGVLGAWLAARCLRRLLDGEDTVGSTAQARFDLSRGFLEANANVS